MKKVILDENLPHSLRHYLSEFDVVTVQYLGWSGIQNGELIALLEGRFDVFVTADQNLRYQQNLRNRSIAIVELPFIRRKEIPQFVEAIRCAIICANTGDYIEIKPEQADTGQSAIFPQSDLQGGDKPQTESD